MPPKPFQNSSARVLLVEDNEVNQAVAVGMLEGLGLSPDVASNGQAALLALNNAPYDLVLMDVQMPVMDGFEATRRIRNNTPTSHASRPSIPIIAMTANVFREDIEKCLAVGMNDHLGKPLNIDEVLDKMNKYLA